MSDDVKAIATLFTTAALLYTIGFCFLTNPRKARSVQLKWMELLHKYGLHPWYEETRAMASDDRYLPIVRLAGLITITVACFVAFLLIRKIRLG